MPRQLVFLLLFLTVLAPRAAAQRLPGGVSPHHYDLRFVVDLLHARFEGTETIRVQIEKPATQIVLPALDIEFQEATIGSAKTPQKATVTLNASDQTATLTVPKPLAKGAAQIHVRFSGVLGDNLRGFYLSKTAARNYAVSQFESTDARRAFP